MRDCEQSVRLILILSCLIFVGVSGLATACSLALSGHRVRVFEAAPTLVRRAGGIRVPPNLTRILVEWGLGPQLEAKGVKYTGYTFLDREC